MKRIIKRIENRLIAEKTTLLNRTEMWFLTCSEAELLSRQDLGAEVLQTLVSLRNDGFALLKNNIAPELCDALVADFNRYCARSPEAAKYKDAQGLHSRLALFHYNSEPAMQVATAKRTADVIRAAFGGEFNIVGSLFFEKGSTQSVHRDTPAFFTNPLNHFLGVWNALEDIRSGSGELCYFRGGHKIARDAALYDDPAVTISNYFELVEKACIESGLKLEMFTPSKGDTLIWLPELPHGGSPRTDVASTRRSMVFHYLPSGIPIHGVNEFFDATKPLFVRENYPVRLKNGTRLIDMGQVRFYQNHKDGNFEEG